MLRSSKQPGLSPRNYYQEDDVFLAASMHDVYGELPANYSYYGDCDESWNSGWRGETYYGGSWESGSWDGGSWGDQSIGSSVSEAGEGVFEAEQQSSSGGESAEDVAAAEAFLLKREQKRAFKKYSSSKKKSSSSSSSSTASSGSGRGSPGGSHRGFGKGKTKKGSMNGHSNFKGYRPKGKGKSKGKKGYTSEAGKKGKSKGFFAAEDHAARGRTDQLRRRPESLL